MYKDPHKHTQTYFYIPWYAWDFPSAALKGEAQVIDSHSSGNQQRDQIPHLIFLKVNAVLFCLCNYLLCFVYSVVKKEQPYSTPTLLFLR